MGMSGFRLKLVAIVLVLSHGFAATDPARAQTPASRVAEALQNITTLVRDGRVGYATFWDGNKFVQCRRLPAGDMRCEAAGTAMQPSLKSVLKPDTLKRLTALGWTLDPAFGNYVRDFSADVPTERIADHILATLTEVYAADTASLELNTKWVADVPCPPRAGFSQNLAGSVNDAPSMRLYAVRGCAYVAKPQEAQAAATARELIVLYGAQVTAEIQRLRLNGTRRVWAVFDAGIGYVQCMPEQPPNAIYCEAQSAESWAALAAVLTPDRVAKLRRAGYAEPGRAPNYSRRYPTDQFNDAAVAGAILTVLHEAYGYTGAAKLKVKTE